MLDKIIEVKKTEVAALKKTCNFNSIDTITEPGLFLSALQGKSVNIIAEIKKASPSKGIIRENFDVSSIAKTYQENGAAALSILTDSQFFQGGNQNIGLARQNSSLPILRKDFIIDESQIFESVGLKVNAILLIVAALSPSQLKSLYQTATELGLDVLVECHDEYEIEAALSIKPQIIGINNRSLKTFKTNLQTSYDLSSMLPDSVTTITESGVNNLQDIKLMRTHNINNFLIGEALMREDDIGHKLQSLLGR